MEDRRPFFVRDKLSESSFVMRWGAFAEVCPFPDFLVAVRGSSRDVRVLTKRWNTRLKRTRRGDLRDELRFRSFVVRASFRGDEFANLRDQKAPVEKALRRLLADSRCETGDAEFKSDAFFFVLLTARAFGSLVCIWESNVVGHITAVEPFWRRVFQCAQLQQQKYLFVLCYRMMEHQPIGAL